MSRSDKHFTIAGVVGWSVSLPSERPSTILTFSTNQLLLGTFSLGYFVSSIPIASLSESASNRHSSNLFIHTALSYCLPLLFEAKSIVFDVFENDKLLESSFKINGLFLTSGGR